MDEKTIQRIKKLQALAERGVGGEKTTAQKKLAKLLKDNGINSLEELQKEEYEYTIFIQKLRHRNASLLKLIQRPGIFHNQLPGFFRTVEAYVQIFRAGALLWGGIQGQVQYIFYGGIVH